jgi:hypothetical protein
VETGWALRCAAGRELNALSSASRRCARRPWESVDEESARCAVGGGGWVALLRHGQHVTRTSTSWTRHARSASHLGFWIPVPTGTGRHYRAARISKVTTEDNLLPRDDQVSFLGP